MSELREKVAEIFTKAEYGFPFRELAGHSRNRMLNSADAAIALVRGEQADRIEQLEAERDEAKQCWMQVSEDWRGACARIGKLEAALREIIEDSFSVYAIEVARAALGEATFTEGHCKDKKAPGGCQLHNLHCGYPDCDRRPAGKPSDE